MKIVPKIRGFICTAAHPFGCAANVKEEIDYINTQQKLSGPKRVLIIGASTGYGLASRIATTYAGDAKTIGVFFERPAEGGRTASPGFYNAAAFEEEAKKAGYYAKSINGDAFSIEIKEKTAALIRRDLMQVDLVIYSLASPRRTDSRIGKTYQSVLKPIGKEFTGKTVDAFAGEIKTVTIAPANEEEIQNTVAVMGGDDWQWWIEFLLQENLLATGAKTMAYSYLGPELTYDIYRDGTIGRAKEHLKQTADNLTKTMKAIQGDAFVAVAKAVVTQASAAIPVVPLYISLLFKVMKAKGIHEGCIEQMYRLMRDYVYTDNPMSRDAEGFVRIDDLEMKADVQQAVSELWPQVNSENLAQLADIEGYRDEFYHLFGFKMAGIDYEQAVDPNVKIVSIE